MSDIQTNEIHVRENAFSCEKFPFGYQQGLYLILRMTLLFSPQRVLILYQTAGLIHIFKKILDFCLKHNLAHFSLPYLHHLELKKYILKKYFLKISKKLFLLPSFTFYLSKVLLPSI